MDLEDEVDYYDLIKAPQYLDFEELVRNNGILDEADPADSFFATGNGEEVMIDYEAPRDGDEDEADQTELPENPKEYTHEEEEDVLSLIDASMAKYRSSGASDLSELSMTQSQADESEQVKLASREHGVTPEDELKEKLEMIRLSLDPLSKIIGELEEGIADVAIVDGDDEDEASQKPNLNLSLKEPLLAPLPEESAGSTIDSSLKDKKEPTGSSRQLAPKRPRSGSLPSLYKVGSPRLPKKAEIKVTIPKPFKLHETRTKPIVIHKEEPFQFKARRAPIKLLHGGPTGLKEVTGHKPTVTCPMSPRFASDARIRERHIRANTPIRAESPNENNRPISSCSSTASLQETRSKIPRTFRAPSPIIRADKKVTVAQPFSFEERDKEMRRIRAEKVRQELESEAKVPEFHANPRPSFSRPKGVPKKKFVELTNVEPFNLKADQRGAMHQETFRKKLEEEERQRQEQATFHANPPTVIFKKPFEPEPSHKPLACPMDLQLNSDLRAQKREQYDNLLKQREEEEEEKRKQAEAERLEYEKQVEILKRKELVHKAIPLKAFRPFQLRSSSRPLTTPMSPAFAPLPSQRRRNLQPPHQ